MKTFTRTQVSQIRNIFIGFMMRDRVMTREQAAYEFDNFLMAAPLIPSLESYYIRVFRQGSTVRLTRSQRMEVWMTFENAQNHATF